MGYDAARGSVRAWLMSTVHHRAVDLVRREEAQRRRAEEAVAMPGPPPEDPGEVVVEELGLPQERAAVRNALEDLPAEQRQVIELMYFDGLSQSFEASTNVPLVRIIPPSEPSKIWLGLPGLTTIACWSGWIPPHAWRQPLGK